MSLYTFYGTHCSYDVIKLLISKLNVIVEYSFFCFQCYKLCNKNLLSNTSYRLSLWTLLSETNK